MCINSPVAAAFYADNPKPNTGFACLQAEGRLNKNVT